MSATSDWFGKGEKHFTHNCGCGQSTTVTTDDAGTSLKCSCGQDLHVPSLSRLRLLSGRDGYETGVVDEIRRRIRTGGIPSVDLCAVSRRPTDDIISLEVTLPRFFKNQEAHDWKIALILGFAAVLLLNILRKPVFEEEGAESITVPLRVMANRWDKVSRSSQARLQKLMRVEPVYSRLLDEHPHARITVLSQDG